MCVSVRDRDVCVCVFSCNARAFLVAVCCRLSFVLLRTRKWSETTAVLVVGAGAGAGVVCNGYCSSRVEVSMVV